MAQPKWKCKNCEKMFTVGEWACDGASNHEVAAKEYLLNDAPTDPGHAPGGGADSLRDGRTRICNIPPDKVVLRNGESALIPGGYVEFIRGRFTTSNPEVQYYLDKKGGFCTEQEWQNAWLSTSQQLEVQRMALNAERQRLENERNELLAQQKQRVGAH